ncbi:MAG TPA: winged helix DNA-binding domain-containing protein [Trebonia sp.]
MTHRVGAAERRGRLVQRQLLGAPAASVGEVAQALVALHSTDPVTVYLSAWARSRCTVAQVDAALYAERVLVRMLGMRRTVFVVPASLSGVVQAACTDDVARRMRKNLEKDLTKGGVGDGDAPSWLRKVEDGVLRALAARGGGATGAQLSADEPLLRTQLIYAPDKAYGGAANITSRVLVLIAAEGRMIRGHRRGGWSSGQFEWFLPETWLAPGDDETGDEETPATGTGGGPGGSAAVPQTGTGANLDPGRGTGLGRGLEGGAARAELARRWLRAFGPGAVSDLQWWAGWTGAQTKAALAALPVVEVDLDGHSGIVLADDLDFPGVSRPAAALLPALDPTPMGWQSRGWYLGPHAPALFDRTGNIGPSVWWTGRVVGGWAQRASGEVVYRLLEDIGADGAAAVAAEAAALEAWLGPARVTPRFRTPLERELSA